MANTRGGFSIDLEELAPTEVLSFIYCISFGEIQKVTFFIVIV